MSVPRLSKQTAEKLAKASDYAEELVLNGVPTAEALVKAADEYGLSGEQGHLLVRGWNTAVVRRLFEKSSSIDDRLSDLDLVNIEVFDSLRKKSRSETKKASISDENSVWYGYDSIPEYQGVPNPLDNYVPEEDPSLLERMTKEAEVKIAKRLREYEAAIKLAEDEWSRIQGDLVAAIEEVKRAFREARILPECVKENIKVANHKAYAVFTMIEDVLPRASDYIDYPIYDPKKAPYSAIIKCAELVEYAARFDEKYKQLVQQYRNLRSDLGIDKYEDMAKHAYLMDPAYSNPGGFYPAYDPYYKPTLLTSKDVEYINKLANTAENPDWDVLIVRAPEGAGQSPDAGGESVVDKIILEHDPTARKMQDQGKQRPGGKSEVEVLNQEIGRVLQSGSKELVNLLNVTEHVMDYKELLPIPRPDNYEAKLRERFMGRHAQAITKALKFPATVVKLVAGDAILGNYPIEKVQKAYTYLHEIAPLMMENLAVAREFVKKYLEQGETLDSYDLKTLVDMEAKRRRIQTSDEGDKI